MLAEANTLIIYTITDYIILFCFVGSEVTVETSLKYLIGDGDLRNNYLGLLLVKKSRTGSGVYFMSHLVFHSEYTQSIMSFCSNVLYRE